jgi:hypothetical protein
MSTSVADVSSIVDSVSSPDPSPAPPPEVEASEPEITTPDSSTPDAPEVDAATPPDSPDSGGEITPEPSVDGRTNPAQVRSALKALRDSDPKNAPIARELNDAYGRYNAYKESFPTVADARNAKAFLDANGGVEGLTSLHETIQSVNETDSLLYAGDPRVLDSLIEDMKAEGKLDAFSKLAGPYLDKLRGLNEKAYFETIKPHFYQTMAELGIGRVFTALHNALSGEKPDLETAKGWAIELNRWFKEIEDGVKQTDKSRLDPDRQAFEKERSDFQTTKQKEFQSGVANEADSYNNHALGDALRPYFKLPYFKNLTSNRSSLISLAKEVKGTLFEELNADKTYQAQMAAFFAGKSPDKSRIAQYHQAKVDTMAKRIVKQVIETRYPDYAKKTALAPQPAAAPAPDAAAQKGQPEYVKAKPEWDSIDWSKDPGKMLFVTGKAYLKGSGKFVYWGKQKK